MLLLPALNCATEVKIIYKTFFFKVHHVMDIEINRYVVIIELLAECSIQVKFYNTIIKVENNKMYSSIQIKVKQYKLYSRMDLVKEEEE